MKKWLLAGALSSVLFVSFAYADELGEGKPSSALAASCGSLAARRAQAASQIQIEQKDSRSSSAEAARSVQR